jgi:hypothetical protein
MSEEEKQLQIGRLITEQMAARRNVSHFDSRGAEIATTYSRFASAMRAHGAIVTNPSSPDELLIKEHNGEMLRLGKNLLTEAALAALLRETAEARAVLVGLNKELASLGVKLEGGWS